MARKPTGNALGRPTKFTDEVKSAIVRMLGMGLYRDTAATIAGVTPIQLCRVLARGQRECEGPWFNFRQDVIRAEAQAEGGIVTRILSEDNSPNLRWYLACKWPEKYGGVKHLLKAMDAKLANLEEMARRQQAGAAPG